MPVLLLDLDESEAAKLLALHDPLTGMAGSNDDVLADLLGEVETENDAVQALMDGLLGEPDAPAELEAADTERDVAIPEAFQVVIECRDEAEQRAVFEKMTGDGYTCRLLTL